MSTSDYKMEIDNPMKEKAIKTAVNDISTDLASVSKDLKSISDQLPALVATRKEINSFKDQTEKYNARLADAAAVIEKGVKVSVDPAKLSEEDRTMLEDLRDKFDHWNLRWDKIWKAIANTSKIKVYLTGIMSSALSVLITLLVCYDSSYVWAHRAFIAAEAKYDENPGEEYSKTYIDMKGGNADRKRAKEHVEGLESDADYVAELEKIMSGYIAEEFEIRKHDVRIKDKQRALILCYHPSTNSWIHYLVRTTEEGTITKVEQELTKDSKRVGWKEIQPLKPESEEETDAT
ncbi:MAG: hypothetical protein J6V17_00570 [Bacteroidales bacterium]|nr:hypothetical protein [Bacteroidales bacterium]